MRTRHKTDEKRSDEKKIVPFNIRVAESEKVAFERAAEVAGVSVSAWVRERLRKAAKADLQEAGQPVPFLQHLDRK